MTWSDFRGSDPKAHIYAQRMNAAGVAQWAVDGVALCTAATGVFGQFAPEIVSDGAGGAIVVWYDGRNGNNNWDIFAQRVNSEGVPQWTIDGVALCTDEGYETSPAIVSDGAGGAIVAWEDSRSSNNKWLIYAQRVNAAGVPQWTADGVVLCPATNHQWRPTLAPDGAGGAIVTWEDWVDYNFFSRLTDIYAQRVDAAGAPQWTTDGVAICTATWSQYTPKIISDGAGGAIITWSDNRGPSGIYAQRVTAAGVLQWTANGQALSTSSDPSNPAIASDGAGGAIVTWEADFTDNSNHEIYARRVNAAGVPQWTADGVAICTAPGHQKHPTVATDDAGGAIITWYDFRNDTNSVIYGQRVDAAGAPQWAAGGVALSTSKRDQFGPTIISDGAGGAFVSWYDESFDTGFDVYVQNIHSDGSLGDGFVPTLASLVSVDAFADHVSLHWYDPQHSLATISRASDGGPWEPIATVSSDGSGSGQYDDHSVLVGERYGYRLSITVNGAEELVGESWVTVPAEVGFALRGVQPNPSVGPLSVSFSLLDSAPATLELFDLTGRRLESRSVGSLGPGAHVISLSSSGRLLRPGVYSVCLTQGSHRAFTKVAIVR